MFLFPHPDMPIDRSGKGIIQRQPTLDMYAKKIEDFYADADKMPTSAPLDISAPEGDVDITGSVSINRFIHNAISQIVGSSTFQDEEDLFVRGLLDSLRALRLTRILKQTFVIPELEKSQLYTRIRRSNRSLKL